MAKTVKVSHAFLDELWASECFDDWPYNTDEIDEGRMALKRAIARAVRLSKTYRVPLDDAAIKYLLDPVVLEFHADKWAEWASDAMSGRDMAVAGRCNGLVRTAARLRKELA